jgi:hypothetical protein
MGEREARQQEFLDLDLARKAPMGGPPPSNPQLIRLSDFLPGAFADNHVFEKKNNVKVNAPPDNPISWVYSQVQSRKGVDRQIQRSLGPSRETC